MREILFLGDSITDCDHSFDPENLGTGYVRMIAEYFSAQKAEVQIHNMGIDGLTVNSLKRLWNLCCKDLKPDFITILIGINDIAVMKNTDKDPELALLEFECQYESLIRQIRSQTNCPILLMEPFVFPHPAMFLSWEADVQLMSKIIQKLAVKYDLSFLPLWDALSNAALENGYDAVTLDGVHLTKLGHQMIADSLLHLLLPEPPAGLSTVL